MPKKKGRKRKNPRDFMLTEQGRQVRLPVKAAALIDTLRDPQCLGLTTVEICKRAGIDPTTYYRYWRNPDFAEVVRQECYGIAHASMMKTMHVIAKHAENEDEKNHHWAKMILQLGKVIKDEDKSSAAPKINFIINVDRPKVASDEKVIDVSRPEIEDASVVVDA